MEILAILVVVVLGFMVLKFISGMVKFAILALIVVAALVFTGVLG
jgi:hypothetical protein